jgi:hypothetical protein
MMNKLVNHNENHVLIQKTTTYGQLDIDFTIDHTPRKYRLQQENQWIKGPSKNQPSGGCQVPKILLVKV